MKVVYKHVEFFGHTFRMPEFVKFMAADEDGELYGFNYEPIAEDGKLIPSCLQYAMRLNGS